MSLFGLEKRSADLGTLLSAGRHTSSSGMTEASAPSRVAVFASVNLLASLVSTLPVDLFLRSERNPEVPDEDPFWSDPDGSGRGMASFLWELSWPLILRGNAVGRIVSRDRFGQAKQIVLQNIDSVSVSKKKGAPPVWKFGGEEVPNKEVWHIAAFPISGEIFGLSPVGLHLKTLGLNAAAENYGSSFFSSGGRAAAILQSKLTPSQEQAAAVKNLFMASQGTGEPVVLPADITYESISVAPEESQFLDTQKYTAAECARIFGPGVPEMLGYNLSAGLTYSNAAERARSFVTNTLNPWLVRIESAFNRVTPADQYVKLNRDAVLAVTTKDRYEAYEIGLRNGFITVNQVRDLEDWAPVDWGDRPFTMKKEEDPKQEISAEDPEGLDVTE